MLELEARIIFVPFILSEIDFHLFNYSRERQSKTFENMCCSGESKECCGAKGKGCCGEGKKCSGGSLSCYLKKLVVFLVTGFAGYLVSLWLEFIDF